MTATHDIVPRRRGFTLVELLVVVAIITLLLSMLIPAASRAREVGRRAVCLTNLRQIHMTYTAYASGSFGALPPSGKAVRPYEVDSKTVEDLLQVSPDLFCCPNMNGQAFATGAFDPWFPVDATRRMITYNIWGGFTPEDQYALNYVGSEPSLASNYPMRRIQSVRSPALAAFATDWNAVNNNGPTATVNSTRFSNHLPRLMYWHNSTPSFWGEWEGDNQVYADGHGQWKPQPEIDRQILQSSGGYHMW